LPTFPLARCSAPLLSPAEQNAAVDAVRGGFAAAARDGEVTRGMAGKGTTVQIAASDVAFLARRGARSHRGGGTFSRSTVLHRSLVMLRDVLERCDPRQTRAMPEAMHQVIVRVLPEPWALKVFEVDQMPALVAQAPGFAAAAAAAGVEVEALLALVGALNFGERMALVDQALQAQAPAAAAATPEDE
jgi:hypothetical protein